jgi:CNT family concentrative nucleoside transporter
MSKILLPEKQRPETLRLNVEPHYKRESNVFEAVINGANAGVKLIAGIVALLIAVLGLVALVDLLLTWTGGVLRLPPGLEANWSLSGILGYVFYPFALVIGIPVADAAEVASLIGMRAIETEVPAYFALGELIGEGALLHRRSYVIAAYGLCGFAHVASMAIFIGGVSALAPSKTRELSEVGVRALIAATLACLMTACVAGTFFADNSILLD